MQGCSKNGTKCEKSATFNPVQFCNFNSFNKDQHSTQYAMENIPTMCYTARLGHYQGANAEYKAEIIEYYTKHFSLSHLMNYRK